MPAEHLTLSAPRALERDPDLTQRQLACELGVSLGRTNYCVRALVKSAHHRGPFAGHESQLYAHRGEDRRLDVTP